MLNIPPKSQGDKFTHEECNELVDAVNALQDAPGGPSLTNTDQLPEGATNKYFTTARVLATTLVDYARATAARALVVGDSVLVALGILEKKADDNAAAISTLANSKGQPNGLASLGADGKVPAGQLPAATAYTDAQAVSAVNSNQGSATTIKPVNGKLEIAPGSIQISHIDPAALGNGALTAGQQSAIINGPWNAKVFGGSLSNTQRGQSFTDGTYWYILVEDNTPVRLSLI